MNRLAFRSLGLAAAVLSTAGFASAAPAPGDAPTYYRDVLPVMQENCQTCHRAAGENIGGMLAPMSFGSYEEVRPWAKSIAREVEARRMPPWFATAASQGLFHHERVLTETQVAGVVDWVAAGAPAGDPADAPPPKTFAEDGSGGWSLGKPDLVVPMPERYFVEDDVEDVNIDFTMKLTEDLLPEDRWVEGVEFKVGGVNVHHMCAFALPEGSTSSIGKFGDFSLGCIALGAESQKFPDGYAIRLRAGSTLRFSMHYNKEAGEGTGFWDRSEIGLHFADAAPEHEILYHPVGNSGFEIPPGVLTHKVGAARVFEEDTMLLTLWPHAHLRAVAARYEAVYPNGERELLLDIPRYDQEWQTTYQYKEPKLLPGGTRLEVTMWFDNTPERGAERGFDASRGIRFGAATTDEMMLGFVNYASATKLEDGGQTGTGGGGR